MKDANNTHQRQLSSMERLSSTLAGIALAGSRLSLSPGSSLESDSDYDDGGDGGEAGTRGQHRRSRSIASMPGSLPGSRASFSDDEELDFRRGEHEGDGEYGSDADLNEVAEQAFDEDLLAAGEMQSVPFL